MRRWFQINQNNLDSVGNVTPTQITSNETRAIMNRANPPATYARKAAPPSPYPAWNDMAGSWRMTGPYHARNTGCNGTTTYMSGGFNDRVYINPNNTNNLFSGQSYGGLWVSKDKGTTWKLTDAEFPNGKPTYANRDIYYGQIVASPTNASLIFAATEAGLLKSANGGDSWLLVNDLNYTARPNERAYWVAPANQDANLLLASYGRRIYRSTDGGTIWTMVFDNSAGGNNLSRGQHSTNGVSERWYNLFGLAFHPTQNNVAYVGAYNAQNQACIYRSVDGGQTWLLLVNTGNTNWLKLQLTPASPDKLYLFEMFPSLSVPQTRSGIFKYNLNGVLVQALNYPVIGHLHDDTVVSQTDSTVLYLGGYASGEVHKSTNGGLTWATSNPGYTSCPNYVHADVRGFSVVGNDVLIATDGGPYLSTDGMATVRDVGKWISAIDLWGFSSAFKDDVIAAGCDHGPTKVRLFDGDAGWVSLGGGDAADVTVNPVNPAWLYANDGYNKFRMVNSPSATGSRQPIVAANFKYLEFHPNVYFQAYPINGPVLMRSTDNLATAQTLYTFPAEITRVRVALRNPQVMFVLVNRRSVYKSIDGGTSFTAITPSTTLTSGRTNITDLDINEMGTNVWLSYGQVQTTCKLVRSTDGGTTWSNYSTGLPSPTASNVTCQRGTNGGVYASTDGGGIWYRDNAMNSWAMLGVGLPMLGYVRSTYVVPNKQAFRMGTSRGVFEHQTAFSSAVMAQISVDRTNTTTCTKQPLLFRDYSTYHNATATTQFRWTFEGGTPATSTVENPSVTYARAGVYDVSLTVTDATGATATQTLTDFITVTDNYCGLDTLRGNAMRISTQNSEVRTQAGAALSATTISAYTLMAWVKPEVGIPSYAGILSLSSSTGNVHLNVRDVVAGVDSVPLGYHHPNGQWWFDSGLFLKLNTWTHVALIVEPTRITVVKDGLMSAHTGRAVVPATVGQFSIGTMIGWTGSRTFLGEMDEVAIYKRALSGDDIRNLMHLTKNNPHYPAQADPDLVAYYQFNGMPANAFDQIGPNNGDFMGSATAVASTAPVAGGTYQTLSTSLLTGTTAFTAVGVSLHSGPTNNRPAAPFTIYRLQESPVSSLTTISKPYWIWRNWTNPKSFSGITSITFDAVSVAPADLSNPANFSLHQRPPFSYQTDWTISNQPAQSVSLAGGGTITFGGELLTRFGQLLLTNTRPGCEPGSLLVSARSGVWNDPLMWFCGRVPTSLDRVRVLPGHVITVPGSYVAKALHLELQGKLIKANQSKLLLGN